MIIISTYIYLECLDHDPPLRAEQESGQHLSDMDMIMNDVKNRDFLVSMYENNRLDNGAYFTMNTARFLASHKTCRLGIIDETGWRHYSEKEGLI